MEYKWQYFMKKYYFLFLIVLGVIFTGCYGEKKGKDKIIVGMELAYPPFETKDKDGNPAGISVEIAKEFGKSIGKEVVIENIAWDGLIPSLQTKKVDMIISSMTITEDRKRIVDFTIPYANSLLGILVNKNSNINSVEDLDKKGIKVAVKTGSTGFIYAKNNLKNATILSFPDESACVTEVVQGKADIFLYDQLTIYRNWEKNKESTKTIFIPFQNAEQWGIAVRKGDKELLEQLNRFIEEYRAKGGFEKLSEKYLPNEKKKFKELNFKWFFDLN